MSMLLYYFVHSAWNQFKKFLRTWAFVLLIVLFTIGGLAAFAVRWYYQRLSGVENLLPEDFMEFFTASGLSGLNALELGVGLLILGVLFIQTIGAEKSVARLFLPADVNLLFSSDLSPQAILAFRLTTTLGTPILLSVLLLFQTPFLLRRFSLTPLAALSIPACWCLTLGFSVFLKILIYEIGSRHPFFRRNLRWFLLGALGLLGLVFYLGYRSSPEQDLLLSAHRFLNAPGSRWVPVWGWTKGVLLYAMEGNRPMAAALFSLSLLLLLALAVLARRLPADYYEATLNRTQTVARLVEGWNREGAAQLIGMLEKTGRVTEREGFSFGSGGSVYFFKVLYNRFCFSRWGVFTRTGITYLITAVAAGLFDRAFLDESIVYLPTLVLAVLIFFRTVASPVSEDIRKASFLLQPDPIWVKLFYSVLGGTVNCALDSAIPLMAGTAAAGFSPLLGLAYLPVLAGADFFAANAGAFVDVSLPASIGTAFRQLIQILLLYLGVIFDGMLLVSGIADGHAGTGFLLVCGMNLLLGAFFLGLTGVWLYPSRGRMTPSEDRTPDRVGARRVSSRLGLALSVMFLAIHVGQGVLAKALPARPILSVYLPIYAVGFPLFLLCMGPRPEGNTGEKRVLGAGKLLLMIPVCFFVMYGGNVIGLALQGLVTAIKPFAFPLPQPAALPGEHMALQAALLVIASPLMEELVFRRCLMDRLRPYGERAALFGSALLFGLFHAAVSQVCYAALLGLVFGYVYLRTGRLRYSLFLHMLINALTAVLLPFLLTRVTDAASLSRIGHMSVAAAFRLPGVLPLLAYLTLLFVLFLFGGVLFLFGLREEELSPDTVRLKDVLFTPGMGVFLAAAGLWLIGG